MRRTLCLMRRRLLELLYEMKKKTTASKSDPAVQRVSCVCVRVQLVSLACPGNWRFLPWLVPPFIPFECVDFRRTTRPGWNHRTTCDGGQ